MKTICIAGLGNPGEKYQNTYHNIGFAILDVLLDRLGEGRGFSASKKHVSEVAEISQGESKLVLVKPQTYMNRSGFAICSVLGFHKLDPKNELLVVHDDLDLPFGKIRYSLDSGAAGHRGVRSVIEQLGNQNFLRLRFGIAPEQEDERLQDPENYVLKKISRQQQEKLPAFLEHGAASIEFFVANGFSQTAARYN